MSGGAVLYHEPTITTVLSQSAFILALNVVDFILDKAIYCGLVGQILIGMAFGTPGADVLGMGFQKAITDIGYLGLVLLVFEGGLSTDVQSLSQNLVLSMVVALTGILLPIAISFVLIGMCHATVLQAFAAGCALSSTSLGTTFTILKSSGLTDSRLGVILTSAAMLDDVVGLVLVQVISNLGKPEDGGVSAAMVIRPVFVSIAYAVLVPVVILFKKRLPGKQSPQSLLYGRILSLIMSQHGKLMLQTALLLGAITSAAYAGTSVLFAAYLAGLLIASFGNVGAEPDHSSDRDDATETNGTTATVFELAVVDSAAEAWEMVPSQGSACQSPEAQAAANLGSQKVREDLRGEQQTQTAFVDIGCRTEPPESRHRPSVYECYYANVVDRILKPFFFSSIGFSIPITKLFDPPVLWRGVVYAVLMTTAKLTCGLWLVRFSKSSSTHNATSRLQKTWKRLMQYQPLSLYPAGLLGNAMVARGEIGFLISAIAQSNGIFVQTGRQDDLFLVVTWAILLCTIFGPIMVGALTRRVKRIRHDRRGDSNGKEDPLGVWAI